MSTTLRLDDMRTAASPPPSMRLDRPIEPLSMLQKSLLMAELAALSYANRAEAGHLAWKMGLPEVRFYDRDGAQAYILGNTTDVVVVCRGTEHHEWNDWKAGVNVLTVVAETVGRVHRGFKREVDDLWPRLERALVSNRRPVWFTGHSLGGAMATICAGRCKLSNIRSNPRALFTFGSPRVGNRRYVNYVELEHYRWVNNNDIVTRIPPRVFGYRHGGQEVYVDSSGKIQLARKWLRIGDRLRGLLHAGRRREIDYLADHALERYLECIRRAIAENQAGTPYGPSPAVRAMAA